MIGETISVELELSEGRLAKPITRGDERCQCDQCKDEGHSDDHLKWVDGPEFGDPMVSSYESTLCDGEVYLCARHIHENARSRDITTREVIYGEHKSRSVQRAIDAVNLIPLTRETISVVSETRESLTILRSLCEAEEFARHDPTLLTKFNALKLSLGGQHVQ